MFLKLLENASLQLHKLLHIHTQLQDNAAVSNQPCCFNFYSVRKIPVPVSYCSVLNLTDISLQVVISKFQLSEKPFLKKRRC